MSFLHQPFAIVILKETIRRLATLFTVVPATLSIFAKVTPGYI